MKTPFKTLAFTLAICAMQPAFAAGSSVAEAPEVQAIQSEWARLNYRDEFKNQNYKELQALAQRASRYSFAHQDSAEALVWDAIVLSTLAEKKGGLGALSLVKEAKLKLEKAEQIDPTVLGGSVYASLGTLYSKVPGWPIGFGSDKQAERYFKKALEINPDGLDINYFFAEYLADQGEDEMALQYVERALRAPRLDGRPVADQGRREQARKLREMLADSDRQVARES
jgi:tetratricopeptide (TPR) repeat protein